MLKRVLVWICLAVTVMSGTALAKSRMQVYGVWHCGDDACLWRHVRDMKDFDAKNHWLIDRGDGKPAVNLVVLSFVDPMKLLQRTTDAETVDGLPIGINPDVINYFTSHKIRVMLSIGGEEYAKFWEQALATNPTQLGLNAAAAAKRLNVGIEIDYEHENGATGNIKGLQDFVTAYRSQIAYDPTGANQAARLTIDLGMSNRFVRDVAIYASEHWLNPAHPVLDYANAMVAEKNYSAEESENFWQEHIDGRTETGDKVTPLAPAKLTVSFYLVAWQGPAEVECTDFSKSLEKITEPYVAHIAPHGVGKSKGLLGYMFWSAECDSPKGVCTTPPNTCEKGVGEGAKYYHVAIPMEPLRQE